MQDQFPERSWILDREELFALYVPDKEQLLPAGLGVRVVSKHAEAVGYREFVLLDEGLAVIVSDVRYDQQMVIEHPDRPILKFHYRLRGSSGLEVESKGVSSVGDHTGSALYMPASMRKREVIYAGKHELSVTIACSATWLDGHFRSDLSKVPAALADYARGNRSEFFFMPITMRACISQAASALLSCELSDHARHTFFHAKALEILALSIDTLISENDQPEHIEYRISKSDYDHLHEIRRVLQTEFSVTIKIGELADRVGMNESRMMHLFKRLFGETIFDFSQRVRMEFAAKLLEATDRPVTDIAYEVGYDYPSNFTTAFKRHFGIPPKAVRQGGLGGTPRR